MSSNFIKLIGAAVFSIVTGIFFMNRGVQNKDTFDKVTGEIIMLENSYLSIDERHSNKQKFFQIDNYPEVFQLFIGKDFGDFKPDLEKINELKIGDLIDVYYSNNPIQTRQESVNRFTQFIFKNNIPYFIKGTADRPLSIAMIGLGLGIFALGFYLKNKGKI